MTIDELNLSLNARKAAELVLVEHPDVQFSDGRRSLREQAERMASNVIRFGVGWLRDTYKNQDMINSLEAYTQSHLEQTSSLEQMTEGFHTVLVTEISGGMPLFPHCTGDAFDIRCPRFGSGQFDETRIAAIKRTIQQLPTELGLTLVVTQEGKLRVIHAQFTHSEEV